MSHLKPHHLAGKVVTVSIVSDPYLFKFHLEDWADRALGKSWQDAPLDVVERDYARRVGSDGLPRNDEVVYGELAGQRYIVHVSEIVQ